MNDHVKTLTPPDKCSLCNSDYDPDRGGIQGHFGIMPVTFCEWCYSSIEDMVNHQDLEKAKESFGIE